MRNVQREMWSWFKDTAPVEFTPTDELAFYVGYGIDTRQGGRIFNIPKKDAWKVVVVWPRNFRFVRGGPDPTQPLVTAVMPTAIGREWMAKLAIENFLNQTYPKKEMVVISQGEWIVTPEQREKGILEIHVPLGLTIGALHNVGDALANGSWIMRWDDDDIHHPTLLGVLVAAAEQDSDQAAVAMGIWTVYHADDDRAWTVRRPAIGALFHRNEGPLYEDVPTGEDSVLWESIYRDRAKTLDNWPGLFIRVFHGKNMVSKRHLMAQMPRGGVGDPGLVTVRPHLNAMIQKYRAAAKIAGAAWGGKA
jgi:hypothetical protein